MRIDDIYEYDLDKPIYINDDSKSSFYKDGVIKKGDNLPLGEILAFSLREINPNYVLNVLRKDPEYSSVEMTLRNKNSEIVFNRIKENSNIFISLALKLDDDEKHRLQKYLLKESFSKMILSSLGDDEDLHRSIRNVTIVKRWERFYKILNSTNGFHSSLDDRSFSKLLGILYDKSDGKLLSVLRGFLERQDDIKNIKGIKFELEYFEAFKPLFQEIKKEVNFFEKKEELFFNLLEKFFYQKCLSDNLSNINMFSYIDVLDNSSETFFKKLQKIADNKYYEDIYHSLTRKFLLNEMSLSVIHDFLNKNFPKGIFSDEKIKTEVENCIKVSLVESNAIIEFKMVNVYGIIASISSTSDLERILSDINNYKKRVVELSKEEHNLKSISKYEDPEEIEDKIRNIIYSKNNYFNNVKEIFEPLSKFVKKEGYEFSVSLEKNKDDYILLLITEDFLKEATVKMIVKMVEIPNFYLKNNDHFEMLSSILLKDILKQDLIKEDIVSKKSVKIKKY